MAEPIAFSNPSMTPTDVDQRRKLAMSLMGQGTDASPVGHWTQALARVLQGGMGGYYGRTASDGEKEGIASRGAFMQQAMKDPKAAATAGITNPWTTDQAGAIGQKVIGQKLEQSDPMYQAKLEHTQAQTRNVGADSYAAGDGFIFNKRTGAVQPLPEGVGNAKTSLNPTWGQDANGNLVLMQTNSKGEAVATKLPPNVQATKGIMKIDAGTEFILLNQMTGQVVGRQPKDVAGKEAQEEIGKAQGKAQVVLPQLEDTANLALETINKIRTHPGKQYGIGVAGVLPGIPGTQQRGFVALVNQAKGQVFLDAYNALRGGGAITEVEGIKAEQARARMDRAQDQKDFDDALNDYEAVIRRGIATARANAARKGGNAGNAVPTAPQTNVQNRKQLPSGKWAVQIDGQWYEE